jgi:predicted glycosyltransferase
LPPTTLTDDGSIETVDRRRDLDQTLELRRDKLLDLFASTSPEVLLIDRFPLELITLASELVPLINSALTRDTVPVMACSVRNPDGVDEATFADQDTLELLDSCFDMLLVHTDPSHVNILDRSPEAVDLPIQILHTGFVDLSELGSDSTTTPPNPTPEVLVSGGGGRDSATLLKLAALEHERLWREEGLETRIVTGPSISEENWKELRRLTRSSRHVRLQRSVENLVPLLTQAEVVVGEGGFNASLDVLQSSTPAVIVPRRQPGGSQARQARRLEQEGQAVIVEPWQLDGKSLLKAVQKARYSNPSEPGYNMEGGSTTTRILSQYLANRSPLDEQAMSASRIGTGASGR